MDNPKEDILFFSICNKNGISARITNYGLRILTLNVPDKDGKIENIVLGFNSMDQYSTEAGQYFGCIIGQYANRIENGNFNLNGQNFQLEKNENENHIHGGSNGYHQVNWQLTTIEKNFVEFHYLFKEDVHGYPGNTNVTVRYSITNNNEFVIDYSAQSDRDTIMSLTNHSYFNLNGEGKGSINDHVVQIHSDYYLPVDENLIPLKQTPVKDTLNDLRNPTILAERLISQNDQFKITKGFDHCYVLKNTNNEQLVHAATIEHPSSGRTMQVYTTEPGIQFYTANFLNGELKGRSGNPYNKNDGFCMETQQFPNSPNRKDFPSSIIRRNSFFRSKTIFEFSISNITKPNKLK